jgi:hypothetical protein
MRTFSSLRHDQGVLIEPPQLLANELIELGWAALTDLS